MVCRPANPRTHAWRPFFPWLAVNAIAFVSTALAEPASVEKSLPSKPRSTVSVSLPVRNLIVELRQIREEAPGTAAGTQTWSSQSAQTGDAALRYQLRVRNGEQAQLQIQLVQPMQWMHSAQAQSSSAVAGNASVNSQSSGVGMALATLESGDTLTVAPYWLGGKRPVRLEIDLHTHAIGERTSTELPATQRKRLRTTVTVPLGQWVTLAASGEAIMRGTYRSDTAPTGRVVLQAHVELDSATR